MSPDSCRLAPVVPLDLYTMQPSKGRNDPINAIVTAKPLENLGQDRADQRSMVFVKESINGLFLRRLGAVEKGHPDARINQYQVRWHHVAI